MVVDLEEGLQGKVDNLKEGDFVYMHSLQSATAFFVRYDGTAKRKIPSVREGRGVIGRWLERRFGFRDYGLVEEDVLQITEGIQFKLIKIFGTEVWIPIGYHYENNLVWTKDGFIDALRKCELYVGDEIKEGMEKHNNLNYDLVSAIMGFH